MVVGNKADLEELRTVPTEAAEQVGMEVKQGVHVYKLSRVSVCHSKLQNPKHRNQCPFRKECQENISLVS